VSSSVRAGQRQSVELLRELAAEAFLTGWAMSDGRWTARVEAGCVAAMETAVEFADDPAVLETSMILGSLTGIWQTIYDRRARLQARHERAVAAAWNACLKDLDPRELVRRFRSDAYLPSETAVKDPTRQWWRDVAVTAALGWLRGIYHTDGYPALVAALEDAIRAGMAEGEADALAGAASKQGRTGFRIGQAFKAAYDRLATDHTISQKAADAATQLIDATAGDIGRRLASLAGDGAGEQDMTDGAGDVLDDGQAVSNGVDWALWTAFGLGALSLYASAGVALVDWWDVGDERECVTCMDNAAGSPYPIGSIPEFPAHFRCRCSLEARDNIASALLDQFLGGDG
jgi:hypothetical protein